MAPTHCHLLHAKARHHHWSGTGLLSIKVFFSGRAHYDVGRGHYAINQSSYLILNDGRPYSIDIESRQAVESFCLFFASGFAEDVRRSLTLPAERLLDAPDGVEETPIEFFERSYPHDQILSPVLFQMRSVHAQHRHDSDWLIEQFDQIMKRLLRVHGLVCQEPRKLSHVRVSTREELYRRLWRARDYAASLFDQSITLRDLAGVACLSPNHFLRTFRELFGQTPHQFVTAQRLQAASDLLHGTELSVTEICLRVGFSSLGSFSWLFRQRFGVSPSAFRQRKK